MSVANISYGCSSLQCNDSYRQTGCIEEMVCSCVVYILVTEYNDKYTHTRVHEVLEACKQLSRKETFVTYTHPLTAPNGHNTVLVVIPSHVCTKSTTMKHNPPPPPHPYTHAHTWVCTAIARCTYYLCSYYMDKRKEKRGKGIPLTWENAQLALVNLV